MALKQIKKHLNLISPPKGFRLPRHEWPAAISHIYNLAQTPEAYQGYFSGGLEQLDINKLLEDIGEDFKNIRAQAPHKDSGEFSFRFVDLFAGIGGFRLALTSQGGRCVFSSEWDNAAQETYFRNYGEIPFGDLTEITNKNNSDYKVRKIIPNHDILAAGFPCQPFSRAGVSARTSLNQAHGFNCNAQGTLFYDTARIIHLKKPQAVLLENVRNLRTHDEGRTFQVIKDTIKELGYHFSSAVINSNTMVPQNRQRCYMIGIKRNMEPFEFDLSQFEGQPLPLRTILNTNRSEVSEYQISSKLWEGHKNRTKRNIERGTGFTALEADISKPANTLVARYGKDGKECLIPMENGPPRKLTKREAALLQGYPTNFLLPQSKTPTYKQMGNSVSVPVITEITRQLIQHLEEQNGI